MSLDVYLTNVKITTCPNCGHEISSTPIEVFSANITHNLGAMAAKGGIYNHLWRPKEIGIVKAKELIEPLTNAIIDMKACPEYYMQFNADNGWGVYADFVPWIEEYLKACIEYPEADIDVSR